MHCLQKLSEHFCGNIEITLAEKLKCCFLCVNFAKLALIKLLESMCFWCYFYLIFFALFFFVQLFGEAFDVASDF